MVIQFPRVTLCFAWKLFQLAIYSHWNNFQAKHNVTLGNWMTIIIMLIQWYTYGNSFHQLSYFEFAVYFEWDEKLRTYEIGNESKLQVEITFKQNIMLLLEIGWPLLSC